MDSTDRHRAHHDMGGLPAGPVDRHEHANTLWEKRVDALYLLLTHPDRALIRVDELRRGIASLAPDVYDRLSYYERWIASMALLLVEKGVLTQADIEQRVTQLRAAAGRDT